MSVSLDSWERLGEYVGRFYMTEIPPYYCPYHENMILDILNELLGVTSYEYVRTDVVLPEPICSEPQSKRIYLCIPLIAKFINLPVLYREERVKEINNFNIFNEIEIVQKKKGKRSAFDETCNTPFMVSCSYDASSTVEPQLILTRTEQIVCVQLFRVMIMLQHWWQHHKLHTYPYQFGVCHRDFKPIEMAKPNKNKRRRFNNSGTFESSSPSLNYDMRVLDAYQTFSSPPSRVPPTTSSSSNTLFVNDIDEDSEDDDDDDDDDYDDDDY